MSKQSPIMIATYFDGVGILTKISVMKIQWHMELSAGISYGVR